MEKIWEAFGKLVIAILFAILLNIFRGYLLVVFWNWFIIPVFDVPSLTIVTAIGVSMFISLLTYKRTKKNTCEEEDEYWFIPFIETGAMYLVVWLIAWLLTFFM